MCLGFYKFQTRVCVCVCVYCKIGTHREAVRAEQAGLGEIYTIVYSENISQLSALRGNAIRLKLCRPDANSFQ